MESKHGADIPTLNCLWLDNTLLTWALLDVWMLRKSRGQGGYLLNTNNVWHTSLAQLYFPEYMFYIFITLLKALNHFLYPSTYPTSLTSPTIFNRWPFPSSMKTLNVSIWSPSIFQSYPSLIISLSLSCQWIYPNPVSPRPCSLNSFLFSIFRQPLLS